MEELEILRKRLLYQSQHRGMREMDWILGGFAQKYIEVMSREELQQFEALLTFPDQDIYEWFFEKIPVPRNAPESLVLRIQQDIKCINSDLMLQSAVLRSGFSVSLGVFK